MTTQSSTSARTLSKPPLLNTLGTIVGAALGTAVLVGVHHRYRKRQYPNAHLSDYIVGLTSQVSALPTAPVRSVQLSRLQYTYEQAKQAYQRYDEQKQVDDEFAVLHTTTLQTRPVCWVSGVASMPQSTSAIQNDDSQNDTQNAFGVVGIDADRQIVWQTTMPERVHDIVVQPVFDSSEFESNEFESREPDSVALDVRCHNQGRDVIVMGRRPSAQFWVLDSASGQVKRTIQANSNRHFYGHACYSLDGRLLYVTENDTQNLSGKIGIYDAHNNYKKTAEYDSHGIGPHELLMHPDGVTLVVANGGIKTEQASREELNLDTMRPSLVYLNRHDGELLEQVLPEHNQMSIRHLAMHDDGRVLIGIQFQGDRHINVPLVLIHQRGDASFTALKMPNNQWQRFHQYIASVAVDSERNLLCVTTPIGGCAVVYDLSTHKLIEAVRLADCAGAAVMHTRSVEQGMAEQGDFLLSDGQGFLTTIKLSDSEHGTHLIQDRQGHKMSFDNHLQSL